MSNKVTQFKITWKSGLVSTDHSSDSHTVQAYALARWGSDYLDVRLNGTTIELIEGDAPTAPTAEEIEAAEKIRLETDAADAQAATDSQAAAAESAPTESKSKK